MQPTESNQVEYKQPHSSDIMDACENKSLPDEQELDKRIDREKDCLVDNFIG